MYATTQTPSARPLPSSARPGLKEISERRPVAAVNTASRATPRPRRVNATTVGAALVCRTNNPIVPIASAEVTAAPSATVLSRSKTICRCSLLSRGPTTSARRVDRDERPGGELSSRQRRTRPARARDSASTSSRSFVVTGVMPFTTAHALRYSLTRRSTSVASSRRPAPREMSRSVSASSESAPNLSGRLLFVEDAGQTPRRRLNYADAHDRRVRMRLC